MASTFLHTRSENPGGATNSKSPVGRRTRISSFSVVRGFMPSLNAPLHERITHADHLIYCVGKKNSIELLVCGHSYFFFYCGHSYFFLKGAREREEVYCRRLARREGCCDAVSLRPILMGPSRLSGGPKPVHVLGPPVGHGPNPAFQVLPHYSTTRPEYALVSLNSEGTVAGLQGRAV